MFLSHSCHCPFPITFLNWWQLWGWSPGQKNLVWKVPAFATFWFADWWVGVGLGVCEKGKENKDTWLLVELWRPEWKKRNSPFLPCSWPHPFCEKEAGALGCSLREEEKGGRGTRGTIGQNLSLETVFSKCTAHFLPYPCLRKAVYTSSKCYELCLCPRPSPGL